MKNNLKEKELFHIRVTDESEKDVLEYVLLSLKNSSKKLSIFTPNPEIIVRAHNDHQYRYVLNSGSILLPDGAGLILSSWILGNPLMHRVTGVDFMYRLVGSIAQSDLTSSITVGFLGAKSDVALRAAECLQRIFPALRVGFVGEEWESGVYIPKDFQLKIAESAFGNMVELKKAINEHKSGNTTDMKYESGSKSHGEKKLTHVSSPMIHDSKIDVLFVAFGAPKQEEWIASHLQKSSTRVAMGVGGAFDFITGKVKRAPFYIRLIGLEWLYRLIQEPWRWKRQLALLTFTKLTILEWMTLFRQAIQEPKA